MRVSKLPSPGAPVLAGEGGGSPGEGIEACWGGLVWDCVIGTRKAAGYFNGRFQAREGCVSRWEFRECEGRVRITVTRWAEEKAAERVAQ